MLVLRIPDIHKGNETPAEASIISEVIETAIDTVDRRGRPKKSSTRDGKIYDGFKTISVSELVANEKEIKG